MAQTTARRQARLSRKSSVRSVWVAALVLAVALAGGCVRPPRAAEPPQAAGRLTVVASIYPLGWFAGELAGDRAAVSLLAPAGSDPHTWEPTAATMRSFSQADVFIYNGAGLEPWAERLIAGAGRPELLTLAAAAGLPGADAHDGDPHVWLDPVLAQTQVQAIAAVLTAADPAGRGLYTTRAADLNRRLTQLHQAYARLSECPGDTIALISPYFTHPAQRYGMRQLTAGHTDGHDAEPGPAALARLVDAMRTAGVGAIFAESATDPAALTVARETGAQVLVLHPLEQLTAAEQRAGATYLTLMEQNLASLRRGLDCPEATP